MATLASWTAGTLPTVIGSGVTLVTGGGPTGVDAIQFDQAASTASTVQLTFTAATTVGLRAYLKMPASWASSSQRIMGGRVNGANLSGAFNLAGSGSAGQARLNNNGGATTVASSSTGVLSLDTWYRVELLINHTTNQARLGVFALASDTALYDSGWQASTYGASTSRLDVGPNLTTPTMPTMRAADIQATDSVATWVGRASWDATPLDTPVVTIASQTAATTGNSDGTATVTWPAVSGAASYVAYRAPGTSPAQGDFTQVATGVTSPYTFTGLGAGVYSLGIKAKAS